MQAASTIVLTSCMRFVVQPCSSARRRARARRRAAAACVMVGAGCRAAPMCACAAAAKEGGGCWSHQLLLLLSLGTQAVQPAAALSGTGPPLETRAAALPLCTSCEAWCAGECAFAGPADYETGAPNSRLRQNLTLYRMTPSTVTDLDNKNTGDPPGDLVFNMDERAIPMACRHVPPGRNAGPDCEGNNTHSWLLEKDLVYLQWEIEMDGHFGPYQECNLNLTEGGDHKWHCANGVARANFSDAQACSGTVCPRTNKAVGWQNENYTRIKTTPTLSGECTATARQLCNDTKTNFSACKYCISNHSSALKVLGKGCSPGLVEMDFCAPPPRPSVACATKAAELCGWAKLAAVGHDCRNCLQSKVNRTLLSESCNEAELAYLHRKGNFCPPSANGRWASINQTWTDGGWRPNRRSIVNTLAGSWFSTTTEGRCKEGHLPGDSSGCSWRPIGIRKALNYSCLQANVAGTVIAHNPQCFERCADGKERDPHPPSDCWTLCFFNTFLGNTTLGLEPMSRAPLVDAWEKSFASEAPALGGCPNVPITEPHPPPPDL